MLELVAMTPLESTLPGWPKPDNPSMAVMLMLILGIPLALAAVFVFVGMAGRWRRTQPDAPRRLDGDAGAALTAAAATPVATPVQAAEISPAVELPAGTSAHAADRPDAP